MSKADYSSRDATAQVGTCFAITFKRGLPRELCARYWRDVHGQFGARNGGFLWRYQQHRLDHCEGGYWQPVEGISYDCPQEDQIDGMAEGMFLNEEIRQQYGQSSINKLIAEDEQNVFERTVYYPTTQGNSRTYVDAVEDGAPNGKQPLVKLIVWVKQRENISREQFRAYMADSFASVLANNEFVLKLRLHLLEPYDQSLWNPPKVAHDRLPEKQYQAVFEIAFKDCLELKRFFESPNYLATVDEQPKYIRTMHVFPEREIYTLVYDGEPTLVGLRSYPVAETIAKIGAITQLQDEVMKLYMLSSS